jgi:hypothetical protein
MGAGSWSIPNLNPGNTVSPAAAAAESLTNSLLDNVCFFFGSIVTFFCFLRLACMIKYI